jgi:hypothetical protein
VVETLSLVVTIKSGESESCGTVEVVSSGVVVSESSVVVTASGVVVVGSGTVVVASGTVVVGKGVVVMAGDVDVVGGTVVWSWAHTPFSFKSHHSLTESNNSPGAHDLKCGDPLLHTK